MIKGLSEGRPFVWNICETALGFSATAPSPYTVSVGNATGWCVLVRWRAAVSSAFLVSGEDMFGWSDEGAKVIEAGSHLRIVVVVVVAIVVVVVVVAGERFMQSLYT